MRMILLALALVTCLVLLPSVSAFQANESIGSRFRISFEAPENVSEIMKSWYSPEYDSYYLKNMNISFAPLGIVSDYCILEVTSHDHKAHLNTAFVWVATFKEVAQANATEAVIDEFASAKYVRFSDRQIDGHPAILARLSDSLEGPYHYMALYWLDSNCVIMIGSNFPWNEGTEKLVDTIHVETA